MYDIHSGSSTRVGIFLTIILIVVTGLGTLYSGFQTTKMEIAATQTAEHRILANPTFTVTKPPIIADSSLDESTQSASNSVIPSTETPSSPSTNTPNPPVPTNTPAPPTSTPAPQTGNNASAAPLPPPSEEYRNCRILNSQGFVPVQAPGECAIYSDYPGSATAYEYRAIAVDDTLLQVELVCPGSRTPVPAFDRFRPSDQLLDHWRGTVFNIEPGCHIDFIIQDSVGENIGLLIKLQP